MRVPEEFGDPASGYETEAAWDLLGKMWHAGKGLSAVAVGAHLPDKAVPHMAEHHPFMPYSKGFCRAIRTMASRYGVIV